VDAVLALRPERLGDVPKRLAAVRAFAALAEAPSLAAANKRVSNILKKVDGSLAEQFGLMVAAHDVGKASPAFQEFVRKELLVEPAEQQLAAALAEAQPQADRLFELHDYTGSLQALAVLKAPVDAFFDAVMVNADDPALRANRLGLLKTLHEAMNRVADLSRLAA
jgi:glycyl-tRNA synthetase beta chain